MNDIDSNAFLFLSRPTQRCGMEIGSRHPQRSAVVPSLGQPDLVKDMKLGGYILRPWFHPAKLRSVMRASDDKDRAERKNLTILIITMPCRNPTYRGINCIVSENKLQ